MSLPSLIVQPEGSSPYAEVIGDPVAHSKSPAIHQYWLRTLGIDGAYVATAVAANGLKGFLAQRRAEPHWRGCNVTIPHKETVLRLLDRVDERARVIGAVNCIVRDGADLVGYNTDVDGIAAALDDLNLEGRKAALIGAGGAARAALAYLATRNAGDVVVLARAPEKALRLDGLHAGKTIAGSFDQAPELLAGAALIINASPLGMTGCPEMPLDLLNAAHTQHAATLFDMVYAPLRTSFLSVGHAHTIDGLTMLIGQAAKAFDLFFGRLPPRKDDELKNMLTGTHRQIAT